MINLRFTKNKWLPLFIVLLGIGLGYQILVSAQQKPVEYLKQDKKRARIVYTDKLEKGSAIPIYHTSGFVIPAESVKVNALVSGHAKAINPLAFPGAMLKKGQWLVKLNTEDLTLALKSEQARLVQAQANLALEQAEQLLAREELALVDNIDGFNIDQTLVLRKPQIEVVKSKVIIAQNNVAKAQLNLSRATILMPFDGKIVSKNIGQGSRITTNSTLFSVVNTQRYWIEAKVPHQFLALLNTQAKVGVFQKRLWGNQKREAQYIATLPELDSKDRQVKILLAIDNPLNETLNQPKVFINDFLNIALKGKPIKKAWTIKHHWLQADNTIWVVDKKSTLQKRDVEVLYKGTDDIFVKAKFKKGDKALAEKPGIASIGLKVKRRKNLAIEETKTAQQTDNKRQGVDHEI